MDWSSDARTPAKSSPSSFPLFHGIDFVSISARSGSDRAIAAMAELDELRLREERQDGLGADWALPDEGLGKGRAVETSGRLVEALASSEGRRRRPVASHHGYTGATPCESARVQWPAGAEACIRWPVRVDVDEIQP